MQKRSDFRRSFFAVVREHLAFPSGEGGPLAVEEVLPQSVFAEGYQQNGNAYRNLSRPRRGGLFYASFS